MPPADLVTTVAAVAAAAAAVLLLAGSRRSATGWLLLATAATALWWLDPEPAGSVAFTASLVLGDAAAPLAAAAGAVWPAGRLAGPERLVIGGALLCAVVVGGLLPAVLFDPVAAGCNSCPRNLLEITAGPADGFWRAARIAALVWGPALAVLAARRLRRAPPLVRRQAWPMLGGGAGVAALVAGSAGHELALPVGEVDAVVAAVRTVQALLVVGIALGIVVRAVLVRTAGRRMARTVLAALPQPTAVIDSLRRAVADPGLTVVFRRPGGGTVDPDVDPGGQAVLRLERDRTTFAEIRYDARLGGSGDLVRTAALSAGLALEYLAAQARLRAEVRDLTALRTRIVRDGDAERHRLERNLHDGAQQQLVALGLMLATTAPTPDTAAAHAEIDAALRELRTVAQGLFPTALDEDGVAAALRELGDHTRCPLLVDGDLRGAVPRAVGMAIYRLVLDLTEVTRADGAVRVRLDGGGDEPARVVVETTGNPLAPSAESPGDDPVRRWLIHADDRFVAAGGRLTAVRTAHGLAVEGMAPCAS